MQKLLTDKQTAEYLGIGTSTLWRYVASGDLSVVRIGKRSTRFDIDDLDGYIQVRKEHSYGASVKNK